GQQVASHQRLGLDVLVARQRCPTGHVRRQPAFLERERVEGHRTRLQLRREEGERAPRSGPAWRMREYRPVDVLHALREEGAGEAGCADRRVSEIAIETAEQQVAPGRVRATGPEPA